MNNFGFNLSPSSRIDLDMATKPEYTKLVEIEPDIKKCMACGSCAASCVAGKFTEMNLRKIILMLSHGAEGNILEQLKSCMLCGKCQLVCPRGINTRHIIKAIYQIYKI